MTEHNKVVNAVLDYLNYLPKVYAFPTHDSRNHPTAKGVSDIVCCDHGNFWAIEVKVGKDRMGLYQHEFKMEIVEAGGGHVVISSLEEAMAIFRERRRT